MGDLISKTNLVNKLKMYLLNNNFLHKNDLAEVIASMETFQQETDWIPVTHRFPSNSDNVRVTVRKNNGDIETAYGWYDSYLKRWKVCLKDSLDFYVEEVIAWKENTDKPYTEEKQNERLDQWKRFV